MGDRSLEVQILEAPPCSALLVKFGADPCERPKGNPLAWSEGPPPEAEPPALRLTYTLFQGTSPMLRKASPSKP